MLLGESGMPRSGGHNRRHFLQLLITGAAGALACVLRANDAALLDESGGGAFDINKAILIPFPSNPPRNQQFELKGMYKDVPDGGLVELWLQDIPMSESTNYVLPAIGFPKNAEEPTISINTVLSRITDDKIAITMQYHAYSHLLDQRIQFSVALLDQAGGIMQLQTCTGSPPRLAEEYRVQTSVMPHEWAPILVEFANTNITRIASVAILAE